MGKSNPQSLAAQAIDDVLVRGQPAARAIDALAKEHALSQRQFGLVKQMVWGVLRDLPRLKALSKLLLKKAPSQEIVRYVLWVGIYQLESLKMPVSVTVSETVNAVTHLKQAWAKALMNACLRRFLREKVKLISALPDIEPLRYGQPRWIIDALKAAWPEHWKMILAAARQEASICLRVCAQGEAAREDYANRLKETGVIVHTLPWAPSALCLEGANPITRLPGYDDGAFVVQDAGAQMLIPVLDLSPGLKVLDACAAPGGKLMQILDRQDGLKLTAVDQIGARMRTMERNLKRVRRLDQVTCFTDDVLNPKGAWAKQTFDRIVLDAPCSALGIMRRHPDVRWLRQPRDLVKMAKIQLAMLKQLWNKLEPRGQLLYITCSILPEENDEVIKQFLAKHPLATAKSIDAEWGISCRFGRQLLPSHDNDGFYAALLIN